MNRREFLSSCVATGASIGLGNLAACTTSSMSLPPADKKLLGAFSIAEPHAHPYQLHSTNKNDTTAPTIERMEEIGMVACSFSAVGDMVKYSGRSGSPYTDTLSQLQTVIRLQKDRKVRLILKASDLHFPSKANDVPGALMAIEGGDALEGNLTHLHAFHDLGVRMITLMHDHDNEIGFNQRSSSDGPLTPFGIQVVEVMNRSKMIIDVAHAKTKTLQSIAEVSAAPLIDSHTNPLPYGFEMSEPTRLRSWPEMEVIAKTGGMICTWPLAYTKNFQQRTTFKHWAEEILLMKSRLGIEHCGLGTDSGGGLPQLIDGWISYASLPHLILAMQEAGLSQSDIASYLGGNFLRLLKRYLG